MSAGAASSRVLRREGGLISEAEDYSPALEGLIVLGGKQDGMK